MTLQLCDILKTTKILLIDDDQYVRNALTYYIKKKTLTFTALETAEEALELARHEAFDIVICDYKLPGMDGLEFFSRLHRLQPGARRIFITAFANDEVALRAQRMGLDDFLEKPFTTGALEQCLSRLLHAGAARHGEHEEG